MCSIIGYHNTKLTINDVEELNNSMQYRGPDNSTVNEYKLDKKNLFLGHNRLSIQDLDVKANQPMENDRFVIIFNGEIYNHLEIRNSLDFNNFKTHSDTETLLYAFSEIGVEGTLKKLIGMFAIALFDKINDKLYLIRDRVGIKPLYYTLQNGEFAFSSQLNGMASHLKSKRDDKSLVQFISFGYLPDDSSYYQKIKKLPPAHYLVFDSSEIHLNKYWEIPENKIDISYEDAKEKTEELIRSSINYRMLSDLEVGAFLSGGVDSSLVASIMQQSTSQKIKTFSIGFEDKQYDESVYAKDVAKYIGSDHYEYIFNKNDLKNIVNDCKIALDEPFGDASTLPMLILSKMTKNEVTVALSGDGGDELFLGYERYFFTQKYHNIFTKIPSPLRVSIAKLFQISNNDKLEKLSYPLKNLSFENLYSILYSSVKPWELSKIFNEDFIHSVVGTNTPSLLQLQNIDIDFNTDDIIGNLSKLDFYRYLPDDILTKVDRSSMFYSLEARVPLLDHRIVEFAYSLPTDIKLKNGPKSILKDILYDQVPKHLIERPKKGFSVPLKHWFRNELKEEIYDIVYNLDDTIFNKKHILKLLDLHINHNRNYEYVFWNLMRLI